MLNALLYEPRVAAALWRAWAEAGSQPARKSFELGPVPTPAGAVSLRRRERALSPFARLSEFERADAADQTGPPRRRILLIPPLSGAFAFILRQMVESFAPEAEVSVIEWVNARFVPEAAGRFDVDDEIAAIVEAARLIGPGVHVAAVCQAGPATLAAATALMMAPAAAGPPLGSLTLIGAPIAPSAAPSPFSERFTTGRMAELEDRLVVKAVAEGGVRRVFPAEAYLPLLLALLSRQQPGRDELSTLIQDDALAHVGHPDFLDLVTAYMDVPGEFFLDNVWRIYVEAGESGVCDAALSWRGERLAPKALDGLALVAVEGALDQICAPGQTKAVFRISPGDGEAVRRTLVAEQSGHFGLFYGPIWREALAPRLAAAMTEAEEAQAEALRAHRTGLR